MAYANPLLWQNIIFIALLFLGFLYFTIQVLGAVDSDTGGDADVDGDGDGDGEGEADSDDHGGFGGRMIVGVLNTKGRAPVTQAVALLLLVWGLSGYIVNIFILSKIPSGLTIGFVFNLIVSGGIGVVAVRLVLPLMVKMMPQGATSLTRQGLVGKVGKVSTILTPESPGYVNIDVGSGVINVLATLVESENQLKSGDKVFLFDYDEKTGIYLCSPVKPDDPIAQFDV